MIGVVKLVPVPKLGPPVAAAYQLIVPALAVAPSVRVPVSHLDAGVELVIVGIVFMIAGVIMVLMCFSIIVGSGSYDPMGGILLSKKWEGFRFYLSSEVSFIFNA